LCATFEVLTCYGYVLTYKALTPSTPAVPNCCYPRRSAPYWSNPAFLITDIPALWRSMLSARAPECQKLKVILEDTQFVYYYRPK